MGVINSELSLFLVLVCIARSRFFRLHVPLSPPPAPRSWHSSSTCHLLKAVWFHISMYLAIFFSFFFIVYSLLFDIHSHWKYCPHFSPLMLIRILGLFLLLFTINLNGWREISLWQKDVKYADFRLNDEVWWPCRRILKCSWNFLKILKKGHPRASLDWKRCRI